MHNLVKLFLLCSQIEIPFGDKDQKGDFTLQLDDLVEFSIATDRRDGLQRATQIELLESSFEKSKEIREVVSAAFFLY